jgi:hypothetical protein
MFFNDDLLTDVISVIDTKIREVRQQSNPSSVDKNYLVRNGHRAGLNIFVSSNRPAEVYIVLKVVFIRNKNKPGSSLFARPCEEAFGHGGPPWLPANFALSHDTKKSRHLKSAIPQR